MSNTSPGPVTSTGPNTLAAQLQHQQFGQTSQPVSQQSLNMANAAMPSTIQSKLGNATTGNQMVPPHSQTMTTTSTTNITLQQSVPGMTLNITPTASQQPQQQTNQPVATKDRCTIWQGILEFHEKPMPSSPQAQRVSHSLPCTFSSMVTNGDPDL